MQFVPIFPHHCRDGEPLGMYQYTFEQMFEQEFNNADRNASKIQDIRLLVINRMQINKMCCRSMILNPPNKLVGSSLDTAFLLRDQNSLIESKPAYRWD